MAVYFAQCRATGLVKIGFSDTPLLRIVKINADSAAGVELVGLIDGATRADEARLHDLFAAYRVRGEWFSRSDGLTALIEDSPVPAAKEMFGGFDGTYLRNADIIEATGLSKSYVSEMRQGVSPIRVGVAVSVYRAFGIAIGPLRGLSPEEIAVVGRVDAIAYFCKSDQAKAA